VATADAQRSAYCTAVGCMEPAEGFVGYWYAHPRRWNLCAEHMRPIRAALWPMLHARPEPAVAGGDDATGYAT
jgi:hypothetical protein